LLAAAAIVIALGVTRGPATTDLVLAGTRLTPGRERDRKAARHPQAPAGPGFGLGALIRVDLATGNRTDH
jgi:hypothetical protein